jgi:hypothetical protein
MHTHTHTLSLSLTQIQEVSNFTAVRLSEYEVMFSWTTAVDSDSPSHHKAAVCGAFVCVCGCFCFLFFCMVLEARARVSLIAMVDFASVVCMHSSSWPVASKNR